MKPAFPSQVVSPDMFKTQTQQMHQMIDEIDLPNDSLTISSYSQSPNMIRSGLQFSQTHRVDVNPKDLETLGRSEMEGTCNDTNKTSTVKSLNMTEGGRQDVNDSGDERQSKDLNSEDDQSDFSQDRIN